MNNENSVLAGNIDLLNICLCDQSNTNESHSPFLVKSVVIRFLSF